MARIEWDKPGDRRFEVGVSKGVLYPRKGAGVAWNGLTEVTHDPSSESPKETYLDGVKYENRVLPKDFSAVINAFTYPDEFANIIGDQNSGSGLYYGQQNPIEFGLSYQTLIGDDLSGMALGYKIHLIYNATAVTNNETSASVSDDPSPTDFAWNISTRGVVISGRKPTAELVISSIEADPEKLSHLENILYGTLSGRPRLPDLWEVTQLFDDWPYLQINPNHAVGVNQLSFHGYHDLRGDVSYGIYTMPEETRLTPSRINGIYYLE